MLLAALFFAAWNHLPIANRARHFWFAWAIVFLAVAAIRFVQLAIRLLLDTIHRSSGKQV